MAVADRVDEIERLIAENEMTSSQVFTQMKQLMLYTRSDINKLKAEAVREAAKLCHHPTNAGRMCPVEQLEDYANKLERDEL